MTGEALESPSEALDELALFKQPQRIDFSIPKESVELQNPPRTAQMHLGLVSENAGQPRHETSTGIEVLGPAHQLDKSGLDEVLCQHGILYHPSGQEQELWSHEIEDPGKNNRTSALLVFSEKDVDGFPARHWLNNILCLS